MHIRSTLIKAAALRRKFGVCNSVTQSAIAGVI